MIKAKFDMAKLRRSISTAAKGFGETNRQAVARWGVQTCRELAVSTQLFGRSGTRKKQEQAIEAGMRAVVVPVSAKEFQRIQATGRAAIGRRWQDLDPSRILTSPDQIQGWIERNRRDSNGHTVRLPPEKMAVCREQDFRAALRERKTRAGMAKGAWIGAGRAIGRHQKGANRITIGANFLSYAQKHERMGSATRSADPFRPVATMRNRVRHTCKNYVLSKSQAQRAVYFGGRKTLTWYRKAAKASLDK